MSDHDRQTVIYRVVEGNVTLEVILLDSDDEDNAPAREVYGPNNLGVEPPTGKLDVRV